MVGFWLIHVRLINMDKKNFRAIHKKAFSLIELSIVLVIISILVAGSLSVSVTAINNAKTRITNERIQLIYKALGNYIQLHYALPCPASLYSAKSSSGYGISVGSAGSCKSTDASGDGIFLANRNNNVMYGAVPVNTIGLADDIAEDGFGNKFAYVINKKLTIAEYPDNTYSEGFSSHSNADVDWIDVVDITSTNSVEENAVAIISLGANKYGAFNANSSTQNSGSSDSYEEQNYPTNIVIDSGGNTADYGQNTSFGGDVEVAFTGSYAASDVFDDVIFSKTRLQIVNDFNVQFLIPCAATTINSRSYQKTFGGMLQYANLACTNPSTRTPSYRCGPSGSWVKVDGCIEP